MMTCQGCESEILPEHDSFGNAEETDPHKFQGDAALHLHVTGGYGEFFDREPFDLLFCHECGHKIFGLFPHLVESFRGAHSLRAGTPMIDAMCWGLEGEKGKENVFYGDGRRDPRDT